MNSKRSDLSLDTFKNSIAVWYPITVRCLCSMIGNMTTNIRCFSQRLAPSTLGNNAGNF